MRVDGLLAEGPHEWPLREVQTSRHNGCTRLIALQHRLQAQSFVGCMKNTQVSSLFFHSTIHVDNGAKFS